MVLRWDLVSLVWVEILCIELRRSCYAPTNFTFPGARLILLGPKRVSQYSCLISGFASLSVCLNFMVSVWSHLEKGDFSVTPLVMVSLGPGPLGQKHHCQFRG